MSNAARIRPSPAPGIPAPRRRRHAGVRMHARQRAGPAGARRRAAHRTRARTTRSDGISALPRRAADAAGHGRLPRRTPWGGVLPKTGDDGRAGVRADQEPRSLSVVAARAREGPARVGVHCFVVADPHVPKRHRAGCSTPDGPQAQGQRRPRMRSRGKAISAPSPRGRSPESRRFATRWRLAFPRGKLACGPLRPGTRRRRGCTTPVAATATAS
jgi:hypothetical protein